MRISTSMRAGARRGAIRALVGAVATALASAAFAGPGLDLPGKGAPPSIGLPQAQPDRPEVVIEASLDRARVRPGDQLGVAVVLDHARGWHSWPAKELDALPAEIADFAIYTTIEVGEAGWLDAVGPVQWPELHEAKNPLGEPPTVMTFAGRAIAYVPITIDADAPLGPQTLTVTVGHQACDDSQCLMPETKTFELPVEVVALGAPVDEPGAQTQALFEGFDRTVYARMAEGATTQGAGGASTGAPGAATGSKIFGISLAFLEGPLGMVLLLLLSAVGGFVLNLTPCVLPVIPIKVMTLTQHAGHPGRALYLGSWMAVGVVAFWLGIGVPAIIFASFADPSKIFGIWWLTLAIGVILGALALGLMGMFSITLPQKAYMVNPNADNAGGSFLFGVMTGVLGLPCFGFVAGSLLTAAATWGPLTTLGVFAGIGVGMAAPYLVLAAKPDWLKAVPKTGPASELVKQVMGLLLLAAAMFFVGSGVIAFISGHPEWILSMPWWWRVAHWWLIALLAFAAGAWLIMRTIGITKKPVRRVAFGVVGLVLGGAAIAYAADATNKARHDFWLPFTEASYAAALDDGRVVVIDFTAEWCLNCKALKALVLNRDPVKSLLRDDAGVVAMTADLTSVQAPGWEKLRALGQTGIPLLVIMGPGLESPWMNNGYTAGQVLEALEAARNPTPVARSTPGAD